MGNQKFEENRLQTLSLEGRKLIGQAIIDGLLTPTGVISAETKDYNQNGGGYTQKGGGDHTQGGNGDYNQSPASIFNLPDLVSSIISQAGVIREE